MLKMIATLPGTVKADQGAAPGGQAADQRTGVPTARTGAEATHAMQSGAGVV